MEKKDLFLPCGKITCDHDCGDECKKPTPDANTPASTVLRDEERCLETCTNIGMTCPSDSHHCPKCDEYMPDKGTLDYGKRQRIAQDAHTRSELIKQGWKSPEEFRVEMQDIEIRLAAWYAGMTSLQDKTIEWIIAEIRKKAGL